VPHHHHHHPSPSPVVSKTGTVAKLERLIQISEFLKILKMQ